MKKVILASIAGSFLIALLAGSALAATITLSWSQERAADLAGWKMYYAVYADGEVPDPPISGASNEVVIALPAFSEPGDPLQEPLPLVDLPQGLKVVPYPGWEDSYWEITYEFYLPPSLPAPPLPIDPEKTYRYYMAITAYDLSSLESDFSNVIDFQINPPGQPGQPLPDGLIPEGEQALASVPLTVPPLRVPATFAPEGAPANLTVRVIGQQPER